MEPTPTELAILSTIVYFDVFAYPLTPLEAWKWLYWEDESEPPTFGDVLVALEQSDYLVRRLGTREGLYFLAGRDALVRQRKDRYLLAERKYRRVQHAIRFFRCIPFIRCIAVCNTLAYSNTRDDGDLDLLILTEPGKIWTARMLATSIAKGMGWRTDFYHTRDAICLSFFLADDDADLQTIAMGEDRYLQYWLDQLVPMYGDEGALDRLRAGNSWHRERLPNAFGTQPAHRRIVEDAPHALVLRSIVRTVHAGMLGRILEHRYESIQRRVLPERLQAMVNKDSRVVMNDQMLKFHDNDRREDFARQFAERLASTV